MNLGIKLMHSTSTSTDDYLYLEVVGGVRQQSRTKIVFTHKRTLTHILWQVKPSKGCEQCLLHGVECVVMLFYPDKDTEVPYKFAVIPC
jgi:hypothetical protein